MKHKRYWYMDYGSGREWRNTYLEFQDNRGDFAHTMDKEYKCIDNEFIIFTAEDPE